MKDFQLATLVPIIDEGGCRGHLLRSARGWRAYDGKDDLVGYFANQSEAVAALLSAAAPMDSDDKASRASRIEEKAGLRSRERATG